MKGITIFSLPGHGVSVWAAPALPAPLSDQRYSAGGASEASRLP